MTGAYAYTPDIGLPLVTAILMAALGLYCWRRRSTPGALPLLALSLFTISFAAAMALEAAAIGPATKIAWFKIHTICMLPALTCGTCFVLEYVYPRRWLTPRNLTLLALPPLLTLLLLVTNDSRLIWQGLEIGAGGVVVPHLASAGRIIWVYGLGLMVVNAAALLWLYIRSPQHRWPAAIMLCGQIAARGLFLIDSLHLSQSLPSFDWTITGTLIVSSTYVIALFGFRIFDPVALARQTAIEQLASGMLVLDAQERVVSMNPAAERILGVASARARGQPVRQLLPAYAAEPGGREAELSLGAGDAPRQYTLAVSPLRDGRGLEAGRLLLLHDVTAQRRAQAQILEQQRALATLHERERIARELHDNLGQVLGFVKMQGHAARSALARDQAAKADEYLAQMVAVVQDAHTDVREYILGAGADAQPGAGFFAGLAQYLQRYSQTYGVATELVVPPELSDQSFEPGAEAQLLRIIQEALTNVRKHAQAHAAQVIFRACDGRAEATVQDDGAGFDPALLDGESGPHYGLRFMRERAQEVGGTVDIDTAPGRGTRVIISMPIRREQV